jgi:hypothetical protein
MNTLPMRISSVTSTFFGSFYHGFIRVEDEYHDVSNKSPKKPSRFCHNSVRISILKTNLINS